MRGRVWKEHQATSNRRYPVQGYLWRFKVIELKVSLSGSRLVGTLKYSCILKWDVW